MLTTIIRNYRGWAIAVIMLFPFVIPYSAKAQPGTAEDGRKLFVQNCAQCHGPDGSGSTAIGKAVGAKDLRSPAAQKLSDVEIATQINQGKGNMPPFSGSLNKVNVNDLVAFVRELGIKQATPMRP